MGHELFGGLQALLIARHPCGTWAGLLPLLPSGPGGICDHPIAQDPAINGACKPVETSAVKFPPKKSWRRERDSNPRYTMNAHTISSRAPSAARASLQVPDEADFLQEACPRPFQRLLCYFLRLREGLSGEMAQSL